MVNHSIKLTYKKKIFFFNLTNEISPAEKSELIKRLLLTLIQDKVLFLNE